MNPCMSLMGSDSLKRGTSLFGMLNLRSSSIIMDMDSEDQHGDMGFSLIWHATWSLVASDRGLKDSDMQYGLF